LLQVGAEQAEAGDGDLKGLEKAAGRQAGSDWRRTQPDTHKRAGIR
jgi:hypothetical protein